MFSSNGFFPTTTQIERKNILKKDEGEKLVHMDNMRLKECNLPRLSKNDSYKRRK